MDYAILHGNYKICLHHYEKNQKLNMKTINQYENFAKSKNYGYVDYKVMIQNLKMFIDFENVPNFLKKPVEEGKIIFYFQYLIYFYLILRDDI